MSKKLQDDLIEMLESARFEEKEEKKLDFLHDKECPKMFGISNIVSHIRIESEVAWDDPRPDDV